MFSIKNNNFIFGAKDLQINNIDNPLAVLNDQILFSWKIYSNLRETYQSAYRIKIASKKELLTDGNSDVWDSGKVNCSRNVNIHIKDAALKPNKRYWWNVIIWDKFDGLGTPSIPAFFDTGLANWKAKWIWKPGVIVKNDFLYTRKEFVLTEEIALAKVFTSAHNHYRLYINGVKVGGFVSPVPSEPNKSKYYIGLDITWLLKKGVNTISAIAHYLGGDGQNYVNGFPGFISQIEIMNLDGTSKTICTDESWKCMSDTPFTSGLSYQQNRRISAIEEFNANMEPQGWTQPNFDQSTWSNAVLSRINSEGWVLKPQTIAEGFEEEVLTTIQYNLLDDVKIFDIGKITTGWPRLKIKGLTNSTVTMRYSENLNINGRVGHNVTNENSDNHFDRIILRDNEVDEWQPDFSYKSFRYLEIEGYPDYINKENLKMISAHTKLDYSGYFNCSNSLLNEIYAACIQTQKNNSLGQLVDCPHREQAQYLGDSDIQAETLIYNFDAHNILEKVLSDFMDAQQPNGIFPFVFPSNYQHPDFAIIIPEWDLHFCMLLWKIIYYYDDLTLLEKYYPTAVKVINYYMGYLDHSTGLVRKTNYWHISDWPFPDIDQSGEHFSVQNCLIYYCLSVMEKMAKLMGEIKDEKEFNAAANKLKNSIILNLYDSEKKAFRDCSGSEHFSQGINVLALKYGLIPKVDINECLDYIVSLGHACSTLLSLDLLKVLFEHGKEQEAYDMINTRTQPGWGIMIEKGYKTTWEGFDDRDSHCHAWNAYPARIMAEYITGIQADGMGFSCVNIKPFMPNDLYFAEAVVPTVRGQIHVKWERQDIGYKLHLQIPPNIKAKIFLPKLSMKNPIISEFASKIPAINAEKYLIVDVGSGYYNFDINENV